MIAIDRLKLAFKALKGTSIGDAFGESFFGETSLIRQYLIDQTIPEDSTWEFTDDTIMSIAIYQQLAQHGSILTDDLAQTFALLHQKDPNRGYGATVRRVLRSIEEGKDWQAEAQNVFDGMGSMGNGAAMRVAAIGAYFWDDINKIKTLAQRSAQVTHTNIEAQVGAMAIALAAALAVRIKLEKLQFSAQAFIQNITDQLPESDTKYKILKATRFSSRTHTDTLKTVLGNGSKMLAQDTVPFVLWCIAHHLDDFEKGLWKAVAVLGDRDTICAMVGAVLMLSAPEETVPQQWQDAVEKVEESIFWA